MRPPSTFVAAGLFCALAALSQSVEAARVPGTRVSLVPPPGFTAAERFPGYQLPERGASIMVTEIDGPARTMIEGMTGDALETRGMTLIDSRTVTVSVGEALLLHVSQVAQGVEFRKWMLIGGDSERTVMVVGTFPANAVDLGDVIRKSVLSASWNAVAKKDPSLYEGLTFRVTPTTAMKLATRMSNMLVFTESGAVGGGEQAVLGIGSALADVVIADVAAFSKERAERSPHISDLRNVRGQTVAVGGLRGYELLAEGTDSENGKPLRMYQLVLLDSRTYYLAQGFVRSDRVPDFVDEFRRLTNSFRLLGK